jgi:serine protease
MSLGGPFNSQVLARAVRYAHDKGVVVVCAAGNDGRGKVSYPAANAGAIAVAATQFDDATTFYSNWGKEVFVAAPGGNTRVDQNNDGVPDGVLQNTVTPGNIGKQDYLLFMGTSMASPHVAGVAALLVSQGIHDPDQVAALIKQTARRPSQYRGKHDNHYGAGIIDAAAAVAAAHEQLAAAPHARVHRAPAADLRLVRARLAMLGLALLMLGRLGLGLLIRRGRGALVAQSPTGTDAAGVP